MPREIWIQGKTVKKVPKKKVLPVNRPETEKYSINPPKGMFSGNSISVPQEWLASHSFQTLLGNVVDNLQASLSVETWSNYNTAVNNLRRCSEYLSIPMDLPLSVTQVILYVAFLIKIRGVLPGTVSSYLSGLRMAHWAKGFLTPTLKSPIVGQILTGASNLNKMRQEVVRKPHRRAMTIPLLLLLHQKIVRSEWTDYKKDQVWCLSVVAFFGAFRLGELLSKAAGHFDGLHTLLAKDVSFQTLSHAGNPLRLARIHVKSPKVDRIGNGDDVEVFSIGGTIFCPVKALEKYKEIAKEEGNFDPDLPFFRKESGANYTRDDFNADLRAMFQSDMNYKKEGIWGHSFRAGVSSHMDRWGFTGEEIKGWGRWSSEAYKRYCRLPTLARRRLSHKIQEKFESTLVGLQGAVRDTFL